MWNLECFNGEGWTAITRKPSGDAAKSAARRYQIGRGRQEIYRIISPLGRVWLYGRPSDGPCGMRMVWSESQPYVTTRMARCLTGAGGGWNL